MGDRIGYQPSGLEKSMYIIGPVIIILAIIWGFTGYDDRHKTSRERSYESDVRDWCKEQNGIAMYKGETYSWDCILIEGE